MLVATVDPFVEARVREIADRDGVPISAVVEVLLRVGIAVQEAPRVP